MGFPRIDLVCVHCGTALTWDDREMPIKQCACAGNVTVFPRTFSLLKGAPSKLDVGPDVPDGGAA
jgi:hypothetical protein